MIEQCPACQSTNFELMFDMGDQPVSLVSLKGTSEESRKLETNPITLCICRSCKHVFNSSFRPDAVDYSDCGCRMYNSGAGWQEHLDNVRDEVLSLCFDMDDPLVIEVGAGDCKFLDSLPHHLQVLAVDPAEPTKVAGEELGIPVVSEYFDPFMDIPEGVKEVVIIMRHLLEHVMYPRDLLEQLVYVADVRDITLSVVIEVPCCENALKHRRIEDWTYEHVQHFTESSIDAVFVTAGFDNPNIVKSYGDEVLVASCTVYPNPSYKKSLNEIDWLLSDYQKIGLNIVRTGAWIRDHLHEIAFWGGTGKSAMFLRKFGVPDHAIVVDSHEEKWGLYVPGTGIPLLSPGCLWGRGYPSIVIVTTSWRALDIRDEIKSKQLPVKQLLKFEGGELVEVEL
jgi:hypothetical protein